MAILLRFCRPFMSGYPLPLLLTKRMSTSRLNYNRLQRLFVPQPHGILLRFCRPFVLLLKALSLLFICPP